jgi:DedD protein
MAKFDMEANLDGQLELKKRARRRLVGAAALALLAAIVLPIVMDHEPRQPAQDVQVRIPRSDEGLATRILPAPVPTPLPPPPGAAAEIKPETAPPATISPPEKPAEKPAAKPDVKPVAKPAEKAAPKAAEKSADKAEEARARAALAGADVGGSWLVLIGAYRDQTNVTRLTTKLKELDLPVFTESFTSPQGPRTRVRAGPFKTREAAEQALAKMKKIGLDGPIKQSGK